MRAPFRVDFRKLRARSFVACSHPIRRPLVDRVAAKSSAAPPVVALEDSGGFNPLLREVIEELLRSGDAAE